MTGRGSQTAPSPPGSARIPWPSGTSASFLLLVVLVVLTGVLVGDWLWLGTAGADESSGAPLGWLVGPPLVLVAVTGVATLFEPMIVVRRRHLEPVAEEVLAARRFAAIAEQEGVVPCPALMANAEDRTVSARSVGRPGRYVVIMTPAVLGLARRRPTDFEALVRHELAHIRSGDVAMATFAIRSWHVTLVAMAMPLLGRTVNPDLSLVPSFLVRALVLALVVYAVRAQLLRTREHYADLRATVSPAQQAHLAAALRADLLGKQVPVPRRRIGRRLRPPRWLALHPTPAERAAVIADPGLIGVGRWASLGAAGYIAGAGQVPLQQLLWTVSADGSAAAMWSRAVLFGLVGVVAAGDVVRAWSVGRLGARVLLRPAAALVVGAMLGDMSSIGMVGLEGSPFGGSLGRLLFQVQMLQALTAGMAALGVGGLLVWAGDAVAFLPVFDEPARSGRRRLLRVAMYVVGAASAGLTAVWLPLPVSGPIMVVLALLLAGVSVALLPRPRWRQALVWWTTASVTGLLALASIAVVQGMSAGGEGWPPMRLVVPVTLTVAAVGGLRRGAAVGLTTGIAGTLSAVIAFALAAVGVGGAPLRDGLWTVAWWTGWAVLLGVPVAALAGLVRRTDAPSALPAGALPLALSLSRRRAAPAGPAPRPGRRRPRRPPARDR